MGLEERFVSLRMSAACVHLSREQITELLGITATLLDERKRLLRLLAELPDSFAEVRNRLNEIARLIR